jgi:hypothetical protein
VISCSPFSQLSFWRNAMREVTGALI